MFPVFGTKHTHAHTHKQLLFNWPFVNAHYEYGWSSELSFGLQYELFRPNGICNTHSFMSLQQQPGFTTFLFFYFKKSTQIWCHQYTSHSLRQKWTKLDLAGAVPEIALGEIIALPKLPSWPPSPLDLTTPLGPSGLDSRTWYSSCSLRITRILTQHLHCGFSKRTWLTHYACKFTFILCHHSQSHQRHFSSLSIRIYLTAGRQPAFCSKQITRRAEEQLGQTCGSWDTERHCRECWKAVEWHAPSPRCGRPHPAASPWLQRAASALAHCTGGDQLSLMLVSVVAPLTRSLHTTCATTNN